MSGYLGRPDLTEKAFKDGWYITGDIARVDEDGFIYITGRLSRFSKIGGEMVPHGKVEDVLHECANSTDRVFAVTAVPDEKKGEKLAVLHTWEEQRLPEQAEIRDGLLQNSREPNLPLICTNDSHYLCKTDAAPHDVLLCIQTGDQKDDPKRFKFSNDEF